MVVFYLKIYGGILLKLRPCDEDWPTEGWDFTQRHYDDEEGYDHDKDDHDYDDNCHVDGDLWWQQYLNIGDMWLSD